MLSLMQEFVHCCLMAPKIGQQVRKEFEDIKGEKIRPWRASGSEGQWHCQKALQLVKDDCRVN